MRPILFIDYWSVTISLYCIVILVGATTANCQTKQSMEIVPQLGHLSQVTYSLQSPKRNFIASCDKDFLIIVKDIKTDYDVFRLFGHQSRITSLAFTPDEQQLISGSYDGTIKVWDLSNGRELYSLTNPSYHDPGKWKVALANLLSPKKVKSNYTTDAIFAAFTDLNKKYLIVNSKAGLRLYHFGDFSLKGWITLNEWGPTTDVILTKEGCLEFTKVVLLFRASVSRKRYRLNLQNLLIKEVANCKERFVNNSLVINEEKERKNTIQRDISFTSTGSLLFGNQHTLFELDLKNLVAYKRMTFSKPVKLTRYNKKQSSLGVLFEDHSFQMLDIKKDTVLTNLLLPSNHLLLDFQWMDSTGIYFLTDEEVYEYNFDKGSMDFWTFYDVVPRWYGPDVAKKPLSVKFYNHVDNDILFFGTNNGVQIYNRAHRKVKRIFNAPPLYYSAAFAEIPEKAWDKGASITSIAKREDQKYIFFGSMDGNLRSLAVPKQTMLKRISGHNSKVNDIVSIDTYLATVSGSEDGHIFFWKYLEKKKSIKKYMHPSGVIDMTYDKTTELLASLGRDGTIILWKISEAGLEKLAQIIFEDERNFSIVTPEGYYYNSQGFFNAFLFRKGQKMFLPEQFDLKFNRPDLVLNKMNVHLDTRIQLAYENAYKKRLEKVGFTENMLADNFHIPELYINYRNIPQRTTDKFIHISFEALDSLELLDRINVFVNDIPIFGVRGISIKSLNTRYYKDTLSVALSKGKNKIQLSVLNQKGAESIRETCFIKCNRLAQKSNLYLVAIGSAFFFDVSMNLKFVEKDIRDFIQMFKKENDIYDTLTIYQLENKDLHLDSLHTVKEKLLKTKVEDRVIIYVSGHGLFDEKYNYYLATYSTNFDNPSLSSIPYEALENLLDSIPARKKLMLMDACHSGEIDTAYIKQIRIENTEVGRVPFKSGREVPQYMKDGLENPFQMMRRLFVDLRRKTGATIISSASGVEFAFEGKEWENSVFTYCLKKGMDGQADYNRDSLIMISELQEYLEKEVSNNTEGLQKPTYRMRNIAYDWPVLIKSDKK